MLALGALSVSSPLRAPLATSFVICSAGVCSGGPAGVEEVRPLGGIVGFGEAQLFHGDVPAAMGVDIGVKWTAEVWWQDEAAAVVGVVWLAP